MAQFLRQIEQAAFKRAFEQMTQPVIEEALRNNLDHNTASRRILRKILEIPGFSLASNVLFSAGGELLAEHADELWPGDTRPYTVALRQVLKRVGPLIVGASDAATDALEIVGNEAVDRVTSPTAIPTNERRGVMDRLFFFYHDGAWRLIEPLCNPEGNFVMDEWGDPIPVNGEVLTDFNHDDYVKPTTRTEKSGKDGKSTRQVKGPPAKRRRLAGPLSALEAAQRKLFSLKRFPLEEAEEIIKLLAPKPSWESRISPDVDGVLSWLIDVLSLPSLCLNAVERQEIEDLVSKMKSQKPDPDWVNRRLGRFRTQTDLFPLDGSRVYNLAKLERMRTLLSRIRDEIDITLEGEQSLTTKARKGLQAAPDILRQVGEFLTTAAPWVVRGLVWWRNAIIMALVLLLMGILLPVGGMPFFTLFVFLCAVAGGILGFAITWPFPFIQKVYDYLQTFISGYSVDSINALGRKIASFALCVGAGVLPLTIWLEFPVVMRTGIVAFGGLFPIGVVFALREAGYPDLAQRLVKRGLLIANIVFGSFAVALFFFVGLVYTYTGQFMTGPQFLRWAVNGSVSWVGHAGSWLAGLTMWHWLGLVALVVFGLILLSILFGKSKEGTGGGDRAMTLTSILLGGGAFLAVLFLGGWLLLAGLHEIGSWFGGSSAATTAVSVQTDNGSWFDRAAMCADPVTTFEQRQILKCP
ncbi:hypothetical protein HY626_02870 [Candidatus Uhrbacteria bacterium]|nr:hypothetical protein [Candidatus Uhrbacteria bacterium]